MNNSGTLVVCPQCTQGKFTQALGRVTDNGFVVLRFRTALTTISAPEYTVTCQCGFATTIYQTRPHSFTS